MTTEERLTKLEKGIEDLQQRIKETETQLEGHIQNPDAHKI